MPGDSQLDLNATFEDQKSKVTGTLIPAVVKALDQDTFSVGEGIIYEMIHNRHKHQREEHLRKNQPSEQQDEQSRRKHMNSRRNDVSNDSILISFFVILTI